MKKLTKYLVLLIAIFVFGVVDVNASQLGMGAPAGGGKIMKPEDIQNSTYIIGTHVFKNVEMTMPMIMMASKTINSDQLDEMIIYQKTFRGKWINFITGETVKPPETFFIQHIDLQTMLGTPVLDGYFQGSYGGSITGMLDVWWNDAVSVGVELWRSETEDGEYELVTRIDETEVGYIEDYIEVEIERGKKYYYKARLYREYAGKTSYSDFSESIFGSNANVVIELGNSVIKVQEGGSFELESEIITDITTDYEYLHTLYSDYSTWYEEAGFAESYAKGENIVVKTRLNEKGYYWVTTDADELSDISNHVEIDATFELKSDFISKTDEGYLYNLYITQEIDENIVMEVYYRDTTSGDDFRKLQDVSGNSLDVIVPAGKTYEYIVYLLYTDESGKLFGTPETNTVRCSSTLAIPELELTSEDQLLVKNIGLAEKFEVYVSDSENGKYRLIKTIDVNEMYDGNLEIELSAGKQYFKVRAVGTIDGETAYSDFSSIIEINAGVDYQIYPLGRDFFGNNIYSLEIFEPEDINGVDIYLVDEDDNETLAQTESIENGSSVIIAVPEGESSNYKIDFFVQYVDSKEVFATTYEYLEASNSELSIELSEGIQTKDDKNQFNIYVYDIPLDTVDAELYCSETLEGDYLKETNVKFDDEVIAYEMLKGQTKYCKARLVNSLGEYTEYSNVVRISDAVETPVLENVIIEGEFNENSFILSVGQKQTSQTMFELYGSNTENGEYELITEFMGEYIQGIERDKLTKYYKLRSFIYVDGEEVYSEYSNSVKLELTHWFSSYCESYDEDSYIIGVGMGGFGDGIEVFYSKDNETYTKVELPNAGNSRQKIITKDSVAYPEEGTTNYYKFRIFMDIAGERFYTDYSEILIIEAFEMVTPVLSVDSQGEGEPGSYVYDLYINYRDYVLNQEVEFPGYKIDGWELYLEYEQEGKESVVIGNTTYTLIEDHTEFGVVPRNYIWGSGKSYNYIARVYYYEGEEKVYSEWSDILTINAEILGITDEPTE